MPSLPTLRAWWALHRSLLLPLLLAVGVLTAALTLTQVGDYALALLARRHVVKQTSQLMQRSDARHAAYLRGQAAADSQYFQLDGQRQEAARAAQQSKARYEKSIARLPAAPVLPLHPPRYRPRGGAAAAR